MNTAKQVSGIDSGPADRRLYAVPGVESRLQRELEEQLESVVAFADFCTFLTSNRVSERAEQLLDLARSLHAETTDDLQRSRPRG